MLISMAKKGRVSGDYPWRGDPQPTGVPIVVRHVGTVATREIVLPPGHQISSLDGWRPPTGAHRWLYATETRRDGWARWAAYFAGILPPSAAPPLELDVIEWSPRVGARWACDTCGWLGPKSFEAGMESDSAVELHLSSGCHDAHHRYPGILGRIRVLGAWREPLGAITPAGCAREGFPKLTPAEFVALYCAPRRPDPYRLVTVIRYEALEGGGE